MRRMRGTAAAVFVAALLGVLVGAALVVGWMRHTTGPSDVHLMTCPTSAPPVSRQGQDAIIQAVKRVGPAVVNVTTQVQSPGDDEDLPFSAKGQGSGVIIDSARGYVLTNAHVVKNTSRVVVQLPNGHSYDAHVIGADPLTEVAVLQIPGGKNLPQAATLGDPDALPVGAWVIAIGNPYGFQHSVTVGVLSAKDRQVPAPNGINLQDLMQTDASINPGNSGGALVDLSGNVVGIPTAMVPQAHGIGFAVPIDVAKQVAERLIKSGAMPWLGIAHVSLAPRDVERLSPPEHRGSLVKAVRSDSPADRAGLRTDDVILRVGFRDIHTAGDVGTAIRSYDVGAKVPIVVWRNGKALRLEVTLGAVPANP